MKILHLAICVIVGISTLVALGVYVILNPTVTIFSGSGYGEEEHGQRTPTYVVDQPFLTTGKIPRTVVIQNKTYFSSYLPEGWINSTRPFLIETYNVKFSFPYGSKPITDSNGSFYETYVKFPDDPSRYLMKANYAAPNDYVTVLSAHTDPQAGIAVHNGRVQLLINWPKVHSELYLDNLERYYQAGKPIYFTVEAKGFDYIDPGETPDAKIRNSEGRLVWENPKGLTLCCVPELRQYDVNLTASRLGIPIINETGSYNLTVSYNRHTVHAMFTVGTAAEASNVTTVIIPPSYDWHTGEVSTKNFEPTKVTVMIGRNSTVKWENQDFKPTRIVADNSSDPDFAYAAPYLEGMSPNSGYQVLSNVTTGHDYVMDASGPNGREILYVSANGSNASNYLKPGGVFEYRFMTPGTFGYHGDPSRRGTVTVLPPVCTQPAGAIDPGSLGVRSCLVSFINMDTRILSSSGFAAIMYHDRGYTFSPDNYVLEPGHAGTITYLINATDRRPQFQEIKTPLTANVTNFAEVTYQVKSPGGFKYSTPDGIHVTYDPTSEVLGPGDRQVVTATISADRNAKVGTYWVILSPGFCNGGPMLLLTVGNCPYSGAHK